MSEPLSISLSSVTQERLGFILSHFLCSVFPSPLSPLAFSSMIWIYIWISTSLSVVKSSPELNWIIWPHFLNSVYFSHDLSIQDLFSIFLPVPYFPSLPLAVFLLGHRTTHIKKAIISNVTGSYGGISVVQIHVSRQCFFYSLSSYCFYASLYCQCPWNLGHGREF